MNTDILLTGLVSGLTILLGVFTADWLKRLRDRINYTRRVVVDISISKMKFVKYLRGHLIEDASSGSDSKVSEDESEFYKIYALLSKELRDLSEMPKWPQPNARRIRKAAANLRTCMFANTEHCAMYQVYLHQENAEELDRLGVELRSATRSKRAYETIMSDLSEKKEEFKRQMLSREATNS